MRYTAPFMHDGSLPTLAAVLTHYETTTASGMPEFELSGQERQALLAFLDAL